VLQPQPEDTTYEEIMRDESVFERMIARDPRYPRSGRVLPNEYIERRIYVWQK